MATSNTLEQNTDETHDTTGCCCWRGVVRVLSRLCRWCSRSAAGAVLCVVEQASCHTQDSYADYAVGRQTAAGSKDDIVDVPAEFHQSTNEHQESFECADLDTKSEGEIQTGSAVTVDSLEAGGEDSISSGGIQVGLHDVNEAEESEGSPVFSGKEEGSKDGRAPTPSATGCGIEVEGEDVTSRVPEGTEGKAEGRKQVGCTPARLDAENKSIKVKLHFGDRKARDKLHTAAPGKAKGEGQTARQAAAGGDGGGGGGGVGGSSGSSSVGPAIWLDQRTPTLHEDTVAAVRKQVAAANRAAARTVAGRRSTAALPCSTVQTDVTETFHLPASCRLGFSAALATLQRRHQVVIHVCVSGRPGGECCVTGTASGVTAAVTDIHDTLHRIQRHHQWTPPRGSFQGRARGEYSH